MRTFVLTLLAVSCVRSELAAYAPARGEFPVQSGLAQGYIRYLDANGAERLIAYTYPEPLYGVRRLKTGSYGTVNPLLQSTSSQHATNIDRSSYVLGEAANSAQLREQAFRDWCQQRLQALKTELEKLQAAGQQPSQDILRQLNSLQNVVAAAFYSPDKQLPGGTRTREEHLRLWNEARLKVLQLEAEQLRLQGKQPADMKPIYADFIGMQTYAANYDAFAAVQETQEQKKAREQHLRAYSEHILRLQQLESERFRETGNQQPNAQLDLNAVQTAQQVLLETAEATRAKEEHLRLWQEAKQLAEQQGSQQSQQSEQIDATRPFDATLKADIPKAGIVVGQAPAAAVQDTPEVARAREEHLKLLKEAQLRVYASEQPALANVQYLPQTTAADAAESISAAARAEEEQRLREAERFKQDERFLQAELLQEAERIRQEEKTRDAERLREAERLQEETRLMAAERMRLQLEQDRREELERQAEAERIGQQEGLNVDAGYVKAALLGGPNKQFSDSSISQLQAAVPVVQSQIANTVILNEKHTDNPIFLRFATQPGSAGAHPLGEQAGASVYYNPTAGYAGLINPQNPFLVRSSTLQGGQADLNKQRLEPSAPTVAASSTQQKDSELKAQLKSSVVAAASESKYTANDNTATSISTSTATKLNYAEDNAAALSELEKATREHFRAHEIALEQLRLAKLNNPSRKDC